MDLDKFNKYLVEKKEDINEANFKKEREMQKKIKDVSEKAQDAFWKVVMKEFGMSDNQEIDPYVLQDFCGVSTRAIKNMVDKIDIPTPNVTSSY